MKENSENINWAAPGPMQTPRDELKFQINFYEESIYLKSYQDDKIFLRLISPEDLQKMLTEPAPTCTGLLPPNTLWWRQTIFGQEIALWSPPQVYTALLNTNPMEYPTKFELPMPGLIFVCSPKKAPYVFAAKAKPTKDDDQLYKTPTFNVFSNGRTCPGTHHYPEDVAQIPDSFWNSFFSQTGDTRQPL